MRQRLLSRDLTIEPQDMFDAGVETLPLGVERYRSSLSEELYKAATWDSVVDASRFKDHRDTFAILGLRHLQARRVGLPDIIFERLLTYLDFDTYLAIRLSCRCWSEAITRAKPIISPPVYRIPAEVLEKVFAQLNPVDFNATRHTCRAWMISSLEGGILTTMLQRGGWLRCATADLALQELEGSRTVTSINDEWRLSKRLATECSLTAGWTGNGLSSSISLQASAQELPSTPLHITSSTDFLELSGGYSPKDDYHYGSALQFTVSVCNKFLLANEGCVIYVYSIKNDTIKLHPRGGYLSLSTLIVCPHRVLALSMDTSYQRFAVAALLEDRVGMVFDISKSSTASPKPATTRALPTSIRDSRGTMYSPRSSSEQNISEVAYLDESRPFQIANNRDMARALAEATLPEVHGARLTRQSWTRDDPLLTPLEPPGLSYGDYGPDERIAVALDPCAIYRNLCSTDDPPRSVAICPQRRCVAFGCAAGIELHWIDALTGQDLNRWFPLTASSDFLYFLPPRPDVDSAKKLRLISSASHPSQQEGLQRSFFPSQNSDAGISHSMTWDDEVFGSTAWRGKGWCDHYQAVPVSDGWNVLFTDPEAGNLCLGSDAPPGARAMKLSRRFTFVGPVDRDGDAIVPAFYRSGMELKWGLRVVAVYGEALWLFVVPPDIYFASKNGDVLEPREAGTEVPASVIGKEIGRIPGLVDVAIDASGGDLTIWALTAHGMAHVWQLKGTDQDELQRVVAGDGTVLPLRDSDGDTFMHNCSSPAVHFDGNTSLAAPIGHSTADHADVIVQDGGREKNHEDDEFEAAGGTYAIHAPPLWGRWSEDDEDWVPDYLGDGGEDEGVGLDVREGMRIEVEVLGG